MGTLKCRKKHKKTRKREAETRRKSRQRSKKANVDLDLFGLRVKEQVRRRLWLSVIFYSFQRALSLSLCASSSLVSFPWLLRLTFTFLGLIRLRLNDSIVFGIMAHQNLLPVVVAATDVVSIAPSLNLPCSLPVSLWLTCQLKPAAISNWN